MKEFTVLPVPIFNATQPLLWICRMCLKCARAYEDARDNNKPFNGCGRYDCGSPLRGLDFPHYEGPLLSGSLALANYCFICGNQSNATISVNNSLRRLGMCKYHLEEWKKYYFLTPEEIKKKEKEAEQLDSQQNSEL